MKTVLFHLPIYIFITFCCFFSSTAYAQDDEKSSTAFNERLKTTLDLSDEQVEKLNAVQKDHEKRVQKVMKDNAFDNEKKKERIITLNEKRQKKVKEILSAEQYNKLKALHEKSPTGKGRGRSK